MKEGLGMIVWVSLEQLPQKYKPTSEVSLYMRNAVQDCLILEDGTDSLSQNVGLLDL
jgi:hypothetical protein